MNYTVTPEEKDRSNCTDENAFPLTLPRPGRVPTGSLMANPDVCILSHARVSVSPSVIPTHWLVKRRTKTPCTLITTDPLTTSARKQGDIARIYPLHQRANQYLTDDEPVNVNDEYERVVGAAK